MPWENSSVLVFAVFVAVALVGILGIYKFVKDRTKKVSTLRLFIQILAIVVVFMGLVLGPFNTARWLPLGPAPRDRLVGTELLGNQFPDGISVPIIACY
jgi:hypothetical protein